MIFNDYIIELNEQNQEIGKIEYVINDLKIVLQSHKDWIEKAFSKTYLGIIQNNASEANILIDCSTKHFNQIRESLIAIDFADFGEILSNLKNSKISCLEEQSEELYEDFKNAYKIIHFYKKLTDKSERAQNYNEFIEAIYMMLNTYENFKFMVNYLNKINVGLNKGIESDTFQIRLLDNSFDKDTYNKVTEPMYLIYDKLCEIAKIDDVEPLKIIRMETGSFLIKFVGEKVILKIIEKILESMHKVFIRNLTRDGQKQNLVESTELFIKHFNLAKEMNELGLDVDEHFEIARETSVLLMKQGNILLSSSPDIRINEKVLSKSECIKKILENKEFIPLPINDEI